MVNLYDKVMISRSVEAKGVCAGMIGVVAFLHSTGEITVEFGNGKGKIISMVTGPVSDFARVTQNSFVNYSSQHVAREGCVMGLTKGLDFAHSASNPVFVSL